jgi:myo-inositol 2-dehydrogenase / D-chiro-inositol 1-dehydrogenase
MTLDTSDHQIVTIEINNNAAYGYDVRAELVGEATSITMNHLAFTRTDRALSSSTSYEPDGRGRYAKAYRRQNRAFLRFVQTGVYPASAASAWDGYAASIVAETGTRALAQGVKLPVTMIARPAFYG